MGEVNAFDQPIDGKVSGWSPREPVLATTLAGRYCRLEPLAPDHSDDLWHALCVDSPDSLWTYLLDEPFDDRADFDAYVRSLAQRPGFAAQAILVDGVALGHACFMREDAANGVVETGTIALGSALQRTTAATESTYLMMRHAFDLGYRRYEWKCHALNAPSRAAAERFGFTFEGVFRQAVVTKGRNRDTAWYSVIDSEWPALQAAYEAWLDPTNFDEEGRQRTRLGVPGAGDA